VTRLEVRKSCMCSDRLVAAVRTARVHEAYLLIPHTTCMAPAILKGDIPGCFDSPTFLLDAASSVAHIHPSTASLRTGMSTSGFGRKRRASLAEDGSFCRAAGDTLLRCMWPSRDP
jgi:hypothetical protein